MRLIKHLKGYTSSLVLLRDLSLLDVSGFYNLFLTTIYSLTDPRRYLWPMANVAEKSLPSCIAFQIREKLKAFRLTESECRALARLTNTCPEAVFREFKVAVSLTPFQRMELASPVSGFDEQALLKLAQLSDFPVETLRKGFARWKGQGEGPSNWGGAVYNILKNAGLLAYLDKKIVGDYSGEIIDLCNATAGAVRADELYLTNIPETAQQVDEDEEDYCCKPPRWMMTLLSDGVMYECPMQADRDDRIIMVWFINRILIEKQSPLRFFVFRFDVGFFALCTTNDVTQRLIAEYKFPPYPEYQRRIDSPVWGGLE